MLFDLLREHSWNKQKTTCWKCYKNNVRIKCFRRTFWEPK